MRSESGTCLGWNIGVLVPLLGDSASARCRDKLYSRGSPVKKLLDREYDDNSVVDVERDVFEAINDSDLPVDNHGFTQGTYRVVITWTSDE